MKPVVRGHEQLVAFGHEEVSLFMADPERVVGAFSSGFHPGLLHSIPLRGIPERRESLLKVALG